MQIFIVDAFTIEKFSGNPAGVVLLDKGEKVDEKFMQNLAAELRYSETAFLEKLTNDSYRVRFFTPTSEVALCGHATIASFTVLKELNFVKPNTVSTMHTLAGELPIYIYEDKIMLEQAVPKVGEILDKEENILRISQALNIAPEMIGDSIYNLKPQLVSTGLWDIIVPVKTKKALFEINPEYSAIEEFTKEKNAVSFHVFALDKEEAIAECRDFAPLYGISEEAATGTANGALTYYLYFNNVINELDKIYLIHQGKSIGRPSNIYAKLVKKGENIKVLVGGSARILVKGIWVK